MGEDVKAFGTGGGRRPDLRHILQRGFPGNPLVCIRDLGDEPLDQSDPQSIPPQVGPTFGGDVTAARYCGAVGEPAFKGGDGGIGSIGGGDVLPPLSEHHISIR